MYKYTLLENEENLLIIDKLYVKQDDNEKYTSVILTNQRLLFFDYLVPDESAEILRTTRGLQTIRYKEIYYQIKLEDILNVDIKNDLYILKLKDNKYFEFDSEELFNLLKQR